MQPMLDPSTFAYLKPTQKQQDVMEHLRAASRAYAEVLDQWLPDGPDKTYILRRVRETAMWVNVALTRHPDGSPRTDADQPPQEQPAYQRPHRQLAPDMDADNKI